MIASLQQAGWSLATDPGDAEVIVVNTCGFISAAKKESIETSLEMKQRHPGRKVIMVGCLSERYGEELAAELPEIDGFLGNRDPSRIVEMVEGRSSKDRGRERPCERNHLLSFPGSAYVKIAEGCSNRCTYCAIPLIRGELASRPPAEIVSEARGLLDRGARELVLIAQDLGSWGKDLRNGGLTDLLEALSRLSGDFWVRLLYIHPDHFPPGLLDLMAADARFLPYFDLPFQHAAPKILRAMGRVGDPDRNIDLVSRIRAQLPGAVIRSTFLLGFPGETDADFEMLLDFQEGARPDWLGSFTWSREEDTPAWSMRDRVTKAVAEKRKAEVERRQVSITDRALRGHVGRTLDVLIEEVVQGEDMSLGRAYLHAPDVDGLVVVRGVRSPGSIVKVRIDRQNGVDLEGGTV
jgi:ribosomal protein S12 methylthiotransferase